MIGPFLFITGHLTLAAILYYAGESHLAPSNSEGEKEP